MTTTSRQAQARGTAHGRMGADKATPTGRASRFSSRSACPWTTHAKRSFPQRSKNTTSMQIGGSMRYTLFTATRSDAWRWTNVRSSSSSSSKRRAASPCSCSESTRNPSTPPLPLPLPLLPQSPPPLPSCLLLCHHPPHLPTLFRHLHRIALPLLRPLPQQRFRRQRHCIPMTASLWARRRYRVVFYRTFLSVSFVWLIYGMTNYCLLVSGYLDVSSDLISRLG